MYTGLYASLLPVCRRTSGPPSRTRAHARACELLSGLRNALLAEGLKRRGRVSQETRLSLLRNKPRAQGKPSRKGKETRYRESTRTASTGISQPLRNSVAAPFKVLSRLLTPGGGNARRARARALARLPSNLLSKRAERAARRLPGQSLSPPTVKRVSERSFLTNSEAGV